MRDKEMMEMVKEIWLFIQYGVAEDMQARAVEVVDRYRQDAVVLRLLHEFYRCLPEAREEPVLRVVQVESNQGIPLLAMVTSSHAYLYLITEDEILFLGENGQEVEDDILAFFGYADHEELNRACSQLTELEDLSSESKLGKMICPICAVLEGEFHQLGCPVEVCPWCGGQISRCNCRFDQLGVEQINEEEDISRFQQLLVAKGRIRFVRGQSPSYPSAVDGMDGDGEGSGKIGPM